jgi:glycyl-tRNA synthetase beta chain
MNISAGKTSPLPRYELPGEVEISSAQQYLQFIREEQIILSPKKRIRRIAKEAAKPGTKIGKFDDMVMKNAFLTENPHSQAILLEKRYSELPAELTTLILEKNQMYPMTADEKGNAWYHIVANHRRVHQRIAHGNQKVAHARLDDGVFYFQQDVQQKLAEYSDGLKKIGFHPKAGSYFEKKKRIGQYVEKIYGQLGKSVPESVKQAVKLNKNDKATALGKEFPSLEGVIGKAYALREGISAEVANLLADHYLPIELGAIVPPTEEAKVISLADKIDTLLTLTQVEKLPEGNHDPFEIRKTVYRILTLLVAFPGIKLGEFIQGSKIATEQQQALKKYLDLRFELLLVENTIPQWIAHNVALGNSDEYFKKFEFAQQLAKLVKDEATKNTITDTFKRIRNILDKNNIRKPSQTAVTQPIASMENAEKTLFVFVADHKKHLVQTPYEVLELSGLLQTFFEKILVLDNDATVRQRRLNILAIIRDAIEEFFAISFD